MGKENTLPPLQLNIVDSCPNQPENYFYQQSAWFNGKTHLIQPQGFEVVDKSDYTYQIASFTFMDEVAEKATGAHFFIPEGEANNVNLFTGEDYKWRIRAVSGSGWVLAWHPEFGAQQEWISPDLEKNPGIEFGKNWIVTLIASPDCGQFVVEGIDLPEYMEDAEKLVKRDTHFPAIRTDSGSFLYPAGDYWQAFDRLTDRPEKHLTGGGR